MTIFKLARSRRMKYRASRSLFALLFIVVWVCAPVVPVVQMPTKDEGPRLGLQVQTAHADPFANGYTYRRSITINESQVTGSGNFSNFPVLVSLSDATFRTVGNGGNVTDAEGDDIIFTSDIDGASVLDFEMERYGASSGEITAWVEVPTLDFNDNTVIYMFYTNASVTSSQEDVAGTWDSNYIGVYHMDGSSTFQLDSASSSVRHDGTVSGATANATGKIGPAYDFDGTNDVITVTDEAELDVTNTGTFEAWIRTDDVSAKPSDLSTWVTRDAPNGAGADEGSNVDAVIVGENILFGGFMCDGATEIFEQTSSALSGASFSNWTQTRTPFAGSEASEGCAGAIDSDGVYVYYAAMGVAGTGAATTFNFSTSTVTFNASSTWASPGNPTGQGAGEMGGIDMVLVGDKIHFAQISLTGGTEQFATTTMTLPLNTFPSVTWGSTDTDPNGGAGNENCSVAIDSDGYSLFYNAFCSDGAAPEEFYWSASTTIGNGGRSAWVDEADPDGAGLADFHYIDNTFAGGNIFHGVALHSDGTEAYRIASSSAASGGALSWVSAQDGSSNPNGAAATDSADISVETDGKNLYYSAFTHAIGVESFYTASSSLPAHPFMSKRNAYEAIQVGNGFAFDWAGKPYTFGTSTNTTGFKHVVITQDGTTLKMYENGGLKRSQTTSVDFESNANNLLIGAGNRSDGTSIWFDGIIDEVRVSNDDRSADWIQTQYNNQNATSTFYTLGAQEDFTNAPTVSTAFASNVNATTATLNGVIVATGDGNNITVRGFAYSTDPLLITSVSTTSDTVGQPFGAGPFSGGISGLTADLTYYFRAYATNSAGDGYGVVRSFFTGNATVTRTVRLFEGSTVKLLNGKMIVYPR